MSDRFMRSNMLLGSEAQTLAGRHVAVFGLGGVGSWCAEALARSGVGRLTLIDRDVVSLSNINRQSFALTSTVGMAKTEAAAARLRDINPQLELRLLTAHYDAASREEFFAGADWDCIADCIDLVSCKLDLIEQALTRGIPIISALGAGNKLDAGQVQLADLAGTRGCPLARVMRRELRRLGIEHLPVVYSPEEALSPQQTEAPPPGRRSVPGSVVWVTAAAGMLMAQYIMEQLTGNK